MADDLKGRRTKPKFGPKGFKGVIKTEAGRLKQILMGDVRSIPARIINIMREIPGKGGLKAPDTIASAERVLRRFAPLLGKSVKTGLKKSGGVPDVREMTKRTRVSRGDKTSKSAKVSRKSSRRRGGASRSF